MVTTLEKWVSALKSAAKRKLCYFRPKQYQEERFSTLADIVKGVFYKINSRGRILFIGSGVKQLTGYDASEVAGHYLSEFIYPGDLAGVMALLKKAVKRSAFSNEFRVIGKDGGVRHIRTTSTKIETKNKRYKVLTGVITDITEQKHQEEALLRTGKTLNSAIIEFLPDAAFVIDEKGKVIEWNRAMEEMTGKIRQEMLGRDDYSALFYGKRRPLLIDLVFNPDQAVEVGYGRIKRKGDSLVGEVYAPYVLRGKGATLWGMASPIYDSKGEVIGAVESIRDISEWKKTTDLLRYYGVFDSLTGLCNRTHFQEEMRHLWLNQSAGMIVCDVDGLKLVNDTLGHDKGDAVLFAAAGVIKKCFTENEIVARIGGDEFAVLLCDVTEKETAEACRRIKEAIRQHNEINSDMPLSISIGYAVTEDTSDIKDLFKQADNNMYREKLHSNNSGRSAVVQTLMKTLKERDFITEGHADRLQELAVALARCIPVPESRINDLKLLSQFHDIGKVGIRDSILFKPGPLTPKEFGEMKRHSEIGYRIAMSSPDLAPIAEWILKHHEWWDGSGYPLGLKGEAIPLECRILAVVDAYDAMTSDRPYRKALSHEVAVDELRKFSGIQFAPDIVEKFIEVIKTISQPQLR